MSCVYSLPTHLTGIYLLLMSLMRVNFVLNVYVLSLNKSKKCNHLCLVLGNGHVLLVTIKFNERRTFVINNLYLLFNKYLYDRKKESIDTSLQFVVLLQFRSPYFNKSLAFNMMSVIINLSSVYASALNIALVSVSVSWVKIRCWTSYVY